MKYSLTAGIIHFTVVDAVKSGTSISIRVQYWRRVRVLADPSGNWSLRQNTIAIDCWFRWSYYNIRVCLIAFSIGICVVVMQDFFINCGCDIDLSFPVVNAGSKSTSRSNWLMSERWHRPHPLFMHPLPRCLGWPVLPQFSLVWFKSQ